MKYIVFFLFFFLISCGSMSKNENLDNSINFSNKMTIDEFRSKLIEYSKNSPYPNIDN